MLFRADPLLECAADGTHCANRVPAKIPKTEKSNLHVFELHRPSRKGTKLLFHVIKATINQHIAPSGSRNEVCRHRGWVAITQCLMIQLSIINTQAQFPILLGSKQLECHTNSYCDGVYLLSSVCSTLASVAAPPGMADQPVDVLLPFL